MNREQLRAHRWCNFWQSALLIVAMGGLLGLLGWLLFGSLGVWGALALAVILSLGRNVSPRMLLRLYKARPIDSRSGPALVAIVAELSRRAELSRVPALYYIPSPMMNAFAAGAGDSVVIGVTDGLLRRLDQRELIGVLAHEISHIRNGDTFVMGLADVVSRLTRGFAMAGQVGLLLLIPFMLLGEGSPPWLLLLLLLVAPTAVALLQLALSRTREFDADLDAAELTGDPIGLARALDRLERVQGGLLERILMPGRREAEPSLLRTHPKTEERVRRLMEIAGRKLPQRAPIPVERYSLFDAPIVVRSPRWHWSGLWY